MIQFVIVPRGGRVPTQGHNTAFLHVDNWNDYSFVTMFDVTLYDENSERHDLGAIKIGFKDQNETTATHSTIQSGITGLDLEYFSVGTDVGYYVELFKNVSEECRTSYLTAARDVAYDDKILQMYKEERVFKTSLLRSVNINTITDQFRRVINGGIPLTDYRFRFTQEQSERVAGYELTFEVHANSTPSTNIHAIIGRNGVGKTTLLNNMTSSIVEDAFSGAKFQTDNWFGIQDIGKGYFSGLVSVSFSAFDPFEPPEEQPDPSKGTCYFYIGLKKQRGTTQGSLKTQSDLTGEFIQSLGLCLSEKSRTRRWLEAIQNLESDDNFAEMNLGRLVDFHGDSLRSEASSLLRRMSSGHTIVLLTITKLVARVDEKTLVLFDEPESHLHPPLLSALIRSLSELLANRNAVAIVATHSPVVLQEIPKSCVWKITRSGTSSEWERPESETFGENVGVLTREVFGLEVSKSGFNALLNSEASKSETYEQALAAFSDQLGLEGRAILRSIFHNPNPQ